MPLKFRLKGLAETFVDALRCPSCKHDGGDTGDDGFRTDLSRVTYDGIVVVIQCDHCSHIFVPDGQRFGILNSQKLRRAVEKDSQQSGDPVLQNAKAVRLEVERMNAQRSSGGSH
jgi:hypothetical protein